PGHLDLEDPLPRGRGTADSAADARGLPPLQRGRPRAADDDPAAAARRVPAAPRYPRRARRPRRRRAQAPPARRPLRPGSGDRPRRALQARGRAARLRARPRVVRSPLATGKREREALSGHRRRCRGRVRAADALRRRRPAPAHLPHGDGPRVRAARAARGAGTPLAQRRTAQRGPAGSADADRARAGADGAPPLARGPRRGERVVDLKAKIREVPAFPTPGVGFKDITPLLADKRALRETIGELADWVKEKKPDLVLGAEARGFILGAAVAAEAGCGFVPARRPGK